MLLFLLHLYLRKDERGDSLLHRFVCRYKSVVKLCFSKTKSINQVYIKVFIIVHACTSKLLALETAHGRHVYPNVIITIYQHYICDVLLCNNVNMDEICCTVSLSTPNNTRDPFCPNFLGTSRGSTI